MVFQTSHLFHHKVKDKMLPNWGPGKWNNSLQAQAAHPIFGHSNALPIFGDFF
jgi:hypothetical protein